jgi:Holliday junction resolvase
LTEQQIQKKILDYLDSIDCYTVKVVSASRAGVPDILACYGGRFLAIEVKKPETINSVTKLQEHNLGMITTRGGYSTVATSVADVKEFIQDIDTQRI